MSHIECPRHDLVEAFRDGRLGPQESASMERHFAQCAACTEFGRQLDVIGRVLRAPQEETTPLAHQRARLALLRAASETRPEQASFGRYRSGAAAMMLVAAVFLGFWVGRSTSAVEHVVLASHLGSMPLLPGVKETSLRPSEDARFDRKREAGVESVTLEHGTLDMSLRPLGPGERFVVSTQDATIEVFGTALRVEALQGKIRRVTAIVGTVEVQYAGFLAVIPEGGSWRATAEPPKVEKEEEKKETMQKTESSYSSGLPRIPASSAVVVPASSKTKTAPSPVAPLATAEQASDSTASRDFADAMSTLRNGNYESSAAALEQFASKFPSDARADEAEYLRAIALQRAGRTEEAAQAARRYLANRPSGAHRAEARRLAGP